MKLYNTLSGQSEELGATGDPVTMYVCGITPYSTAHVGHAMRAVVFDVLRRYIEFRGRSVKHVENFTDIDDKMIDGAAKAGVTVSELAEGNIEIYLTEMDRLNILRAHEYPRATAEIDKIVEMVGGLVDKGYAYASGGDVYFRVRSDEDYGKLSHRDIDKLLSGARVTVNEDKEDALDFALWKSQKPGEPAWESPWGPGRPGWHIECSAMALEYLGETIDIHGGGQDLVFPHHENELAQSESFTGKVPFAGHWVHNGLVRLGEDKMSKSLGNMVTIGQALETHSCDALRLFFLSSHYRSPLTYTEENVAAQERAAERLRSAVSVTGSQDGEALDATPHRTRFETAMEDDLNTPQALAAIFDLSRDIHRSRDEGLGVGDAQGVMRELAAVLGLTLEKRTAEGDAAPFIDLLIDVRRLLRSAKQFEIADGIRDRLAELDVQLEDTPDGTIWKHK
jgi:cysteinyl-tRNA synthetase